MNVGTLEKLLKKIKNKELEIVVDYDENGYYNLDAVETVVKETDKPIFFNLISSCDS